MKKLRYYFLFAFFSLLLLFYPGDSYYFHIFAFNRPVFEKEVIKKKNKINPVPYLKNSFYFPETSAGGVYVVDIPSFTPVLQRNKDQKFLPASTTKMITALVAYDIYTPETEIVVKNVLTEGQTMGLVQGENITVENLLYGMLVHSGNDAAYALADNYGFDRFINLMNEKAKSLKMKNSHFENPAGLDNGNQQSSPMDLALAARELLKNRYLAKIASTKEITISDTDFKYFHRLSNVNQLLGEIAGIGGLKTGYTEEAGENLVSFYKKNGHQFIIVILKSSDRFQDTRNIVSWIEENVSYINL